MAMKRQRSITKSRRKGKLRWKQDTKIIGKLAMVAVERETTTEAVVDLTNSKTIRIISNISNKNIRKKTTKKRLRRLALTSTTRSLSSSILRKEKMRKLRQKSTEQLLTLPRKKILRINSSTQELLFNIRKSQYIKVMKNRSINRIKIIIIIREMTSTEIEMQTITKEEMTIRKAERNNTTKARAMEE